MPKVPYLYEVNGKLVTGNGSLIPICSLPNRSLLPSLTVLSFLKEVIVDLNTLNSQWLIHTVPSAIVGHSKSLSVIFLSQVILSHLESLKPLML